MDENELKKENCSPLPIDGAALWKGCMLALCVHGVMLPEYPFIMNEHIWLDGIYLTQDNEGAKGALVFSEEMEPLVGVFRQAGSPRVELVLSDKYAASHFKAASGENREIAEALFPFFEEEMGESRLPVVTAGFWWDNGILYSRDSLDDWNENGGHILERQMMTFEEAMDSYRAYYEMDDIRAGIIERVYRERIRSPMQTVVLWKEEIKAIVEKGSYNEKVCRDAFLSFQVYFEE